MTWTDPLKKSTSRSSIFLAPVLISSVIDLPSGALRRLETSNMIIVDCKNATLVTLKNPLRPRAV
jgi:hypothetical protein